MSAGRILLIVFGVLIGLFGLALAGGGGALLWAHSTQRDDDGFFTTRSIALAAPGFAVVSDEVDLGTGGGAWAADVGDMARVRVRATSERPIALFLGIGPEDAVRAYLADVRHTQVDDVDLDPVRVRSGERPGSRAPAPPADQSFWAVQATGTGTQTLDWRPESGRWTVVMMNADAVPGVVADVDLGIKVEYLRGIGIGFVIGGVVLLVIGTLMVVFGVRRRRAPPSASTSPPPPPPTVTA